MNEQLKKRLDRALPRTNGAAFKVLYILAREFDVRKVKQLEISFPEIADKTGVDKKTVSTAVQELEIGKLIFAIPRRGRRKKVYAFRRSDLEKVKEFGKSLSKNERVYWHFQEHFNQEDFKWKKKTEKTIKRFLQMFSYRDILRAIRGYANDEIDEEIKDKFSHIFKDKESIEIGKIKYFKRLRYKNGI